MSANDGRFPHGMLAAGRTVAWLLSGGVPLGPLWLLRTQGRHTGRVRQVPVAVLRHDGDDWLVSPFGAVAWVRNVRANGVAALARGGQVRAVTLTEVTDARVPALLRTYRRRFAVVPFVRAAFEASGRDDLAAFTREAARHPVFHILQGSGPSGPQGRRENASLGAGPARSGGWDAPTTVG